MNTAIPVVIFTMCLTVFTFHMHSASATPQSVHQNNRTLVYATGVEGTSGMTVHLQDFATSRSIDLDVPEMIYYALNQKQNLLAFSDVSGHVFVLHLSSGEIVNLQLEMTTQNQLVWDAYSITASNLLWSSTGEQLAFTGDNDGLSGIYVYSTVSRETEFIAVPSVQNHLLSLSAWSPDEAWFVVAGAFNEMDDTPLVITALIRRLDPTYILIPANINYCRAVWSPNSRFFAVDTSCQDRTLSEVDVYGLVADTDAPTVSLVSSSGTSDSGIVSYMLPVWVESERWVALKTIFNVSAQRQFTSFIQFDILDSTETLVSEQDVSANSIPQQHNKAYIWLEQNSPSPVSVLYVFDAQTTTSWHATLNSSVLCPLPYAQISSDGEAVALLDGCSAESPHLSVRVVQSQRNDIIILNDSATLIRLLGWLPGMPQP